MSETQVVISVSNLTKKYKLYGKTIDRLKEVLHPFRKVYHREFTALDSVNIEIKKGEAVGIIGKNGSGKSTLLKVLTGVLTPTSGSVKVNGTVAALLELGAGFNPELTGYENIFLNGALMGFTKEEMLPKVDAIATFADIGEFLDQPVKMYSSGMFARLAFSVAINVDPDILIVDEALSVGDIFFQSKCYAYFEKMRARGKTVLFVTHSLDTITRSCNRAVCIKGGRISYIGTPSEVVDFFKKQEAMGDSQVANHSRKNAKLSDIYLSNKAMDSYGTFEATIEDFGIVNQEGHPIVSCFQGDNVTIEIFIKIHHPIESMIAAFAFKTVDGVEVLGTNSALEELDLAEILRVGSGKVSFSVPMLLRESEYLLSIGLTYFDSGGNLKVYHRLYNVVSFLVQRSYGSTGIYAPRILSQVNVEI